MERSIVEGNKREISDPMLLDGELCWKYKERLAEFYYLNMTYCSCMDGFSYKDAERKIESLIEHVSNGSAMVYGTFDQKDLIGFVWAYEHPFREETRIYISEIHVDERYRGRGIGKQLLTAVESMARSRGYKALYIHAEGDKDDVIRLYQQQGYVIERVQLRKGL